MKALLIEDEPALAKEVIAYLKGQDMRCEWAADAAQAKEKLALYAYDCILLDITLPDGNGLALLRDLKAAGKAEGVVIISARDSVHDRIQGLGLGADDYLPKPFHLAELLARVKAVVRRRSFGGSVQVSYGPARIDPTARQATVAGKPVDLTRKELDLLLYLLANTGRVVAKEAIAEHLSGDEADLFDSFDFIYAHIKNLKKKMAEAGAPLALKSVYGLGYKLEAQPTADDEAA